MNWASVCMCVCGNRKWERVFPYFWCISWRSGSWNKRECLTWVWCWMQSMPLTQPEKYSCYALFCFRATTSSLWHSAVIRGKPWIPHISTVNSYRCRTLDSDSTPTLCRTVRLVRSPRTILGFRLYAWGPFTLPIASICNANDWVTECVSLSLAKEFVLSLCISVPQFFPPFSNTFLSLSVFAVAWATHLKPHQSPRRQTKSYGSAVRRLWHLGSKCHWKDCLQHFSVVSSSNVHCEGESSTVVTYGTAAVGQFLSLTQLISLQVQISLSIKHVLV